MTRVLAWATLIIASAVVAAASASAESTPTQIVVTRDAVKLPRGCTARGVAELLGRFSDAFNQGDDEELDELVASDGLGIQNFTLFSVDGNVVYERDRLVPYLLELRSRGERFRVVAVAVESTGRKAPSSVSVNYRVERPKGMYLGKALIDCTSQRIWQGAIGPLIPGALVLPCPQPSGWLSAGPVIACTTGPNAAALSPTFRVAPAGVALPARCRLASVRSNVQGLLTSFNTGLGDAFASRFLVRGQFHPYTRSIVGSGLIGRGTVARFVRARYSAGDGWTASRLTAPRGPVGLRGQAVYGLQFAVSYQGASVKAKAAAKLVVDCRSGLLRRWVGPSIRTPAG